ncbi:MAG: hypothetical protein JO317_00195 [Verrucomicrobiae bacterium]|nr:hypothetical protein [Verrucomicrobiae bacterium]
MNPMNPMKSAAGRLGIVLLMFLPALALMNAVELPFYVYKDGKDKSNRYVPSGFCGDYSAIQMDESCTDQPKEGKTCLKFTYSGKPTQGLSWAGVFFQNPANNWGTANGGYDLTGAKKLKFFARGNKGGEIVEFKMGGINGPAFADSDGASTGPVTLTKDWKQYEIDLSKLDLSYIMGGFSWVARAEDNPEGATLYLDDVQYAAN